MRSRIALTALLLILACLPAQAVQTQYDIQQGVLNKFAGAVGTFAGDAGRYDFGFNAPCFPDFWNTCHVTLYSGHLYWSLANPSFTVSPSGIRFNGDLTATYVGFSYSTTVSGPVSISYNSGSSQLRLQINNVAVPIAMNLPVIGRVTFTTLQVNPNYSFSYQVYNARLPVQLPAATKYVQAHLSSVTISYLTGVIRLQTEFLLW